jgi:uncharacterized RDD family membrane protein YckC
MALRLLAPAFMPGIKLPSSSPVKATSYKDVKPKSGFQRISLVSSPGPGKNALNRFKDDSMDRTYRTFWRRLAALVIDSSLLLPFALVLLAAGALAATPEPQFVLHVIASLFGVAYSVIFHSWCGQTVGKMITRVRVVDLSGRAIGVKQATLRDGPTIALSVATVAFGARAILSGHDPFNLFDPQAALPPELVIANLIWILAEFVTMLTNKRRRAIHDWIAGTLVIRTSAQPAAVMDANLIAGQPTR